MNISIETVLNNVENELFLFNNKVKSQKLSNSAELLNDIFYELKEKSLNPSLPGLKSGFYDLDLITQGFQKSDLIILAGRPSMGKTAFILNVAINIIKSSKLPVLFFSLEMSKKQLMYRVLSVETNIEQIKLKNGKLYKNDWVKLTKMIKILSKLPFFIEDNANVSIQEIRAKIKKIIKEQKKIGLVIIDYLQLLQTSQTNNGNRTQELSQITRSLKNLAREFNIPMIALSQLSRNVENRIDQKPILSDLRESGSIEQDADLVLMLYKNKKLMINTNNQIIELIIAKQRNGPTGIIKLKFEKERTKFQNLETL